MNVWPLIALILVLLPVECAIQTSIEPRQNLRRTQILYPILTKLKRPPPQLTIVCGFYFDTEFIQDADRPSVCGTYGISGDFEELYQPGNHVCGDFNKRGIFFHDEDNQVICGKYAINGDFWEDPKTNVTLCGYFDESDIFIQTEPDAADVCGYFETSLIFVKLYIPFQNVCGYYDADSKFIENYHNDTHCGYIDGDGTFIEQILSFQEVCGYFDSGGEFVVVTSDDDTFSDIKCGYIDEEGFFVEEHPEDDDRKISCNITHFGSSSIIDPTAGDGTLVGRSFQWAFNRAFVDDSNQYHIDYVQDHTTRNLKEHRLLSGPDRSLSNARLHHIDVWWGCRCGTDLPLGDAWARRLSRWEHRRKNDFPTSRLHNIPYQVFWRLRKSRLPGFSSIVGVELSCHGFRPRHFFLPVPI